MGRDKGGLGEGGWGSGFNEIFELAMKGKDLWFGEGKGWRDMLNGNGVIFLMVREGRIWEMMGWIGLVLFYGLFSGLSDTI